MTDTLTIGLTGDVMLGRTMDDVISKKGYDYPWGDIHPVMKDTDMNIINLETALTHSTRKVYKAFNFKASPDKIKSLIDANIAVANIANNHILDFASEGLLETIETLDNAGISHIGAGKNAAEAASPVIIQKKNLKVGLLGITDNEPGWKANDGPGTNYIDIDNDEEYTAILSQIEKLREETDLVIVSVHWGPNMREEPSERFINFAHLMSRHGADVVHGHSAHILQGIGYYNNSLVLYDTGDFIDDYLVDPVLRNDLSAFFILSVSKSGLLDIRIVPTRILRYQVNHARQDDHDWVIRRLQHLSSAFNTYIDDKGTIDFNSHRMRERDT